MNRKNRTAIILIPGFLSAMGPLSIDMYLAGFPAIANNLHTSIEMVSYSLSSFFIGICIGQLLCGPLLDRFWKKNAPVYWTLVVHYYYPWLCIY